MNEVIAMVLTIMFCNNESYNFDGTCSDGNQKQKREINVLSNKGNIVQIKDIDVLTLSETVLFELKYNGSTYAASNFKADPEAIRFWRALGNQLPNVCSVLPQLPATIERGK